MSHVAQASGFGCVRRFNAAIRMTYHRTPSQIRRLSCGLDLPANEYLFRLRFRPPYEWDKMLHFLPRELRLALRLSNTAVIGEPLR